MSRFVHLSVFYLASFLEGLCLILFPASSPLFKAAPYGVTDEQYGVVFLPMIILAILVTSGFKPLYRRFGTSRLYYAALVSHGFFLAGLAAAHFFKADPSPAFPLLLLCHPFLGIGFGLLVSVMNLRCVEMFPAKRDAVLSGLHAMLGLGAAVSPLLADAAYRTGFWMQAPAACFLLTAVCGVLALLTGAPLEEKVCLASFSSETGRGERDPLPRGALLFLITLVIYGIVEATIGNWSGLYLTQDKGFSLSTAAGALSIFWFFMTVGRLGATFYSLHRDPRILYRISPWIVALSLAGIILNQEESRVLFLYALAGAGCSYFFPLSISLSTRAFDRWREPLASLTVASLMTGVGTGSSLTGFIRNRGLFSLEEVFTGLLFLSLGVAFLAFKLCSYPMLKLKPGEPRT